RAMDELAGRSGEVVETISLDDSARAQNVQGTDDAFLQFHQPDDGFRERDIIADRRIATPEQIASSDEMISQVEVALNGAERRDRDAFILFAIEGFTPHEIAGISDRSVEEVQRSITAARDQLKRAVSVPNEFKDELLKHSK